MRVQKERIDDTNDLLPVLAAAALGGAVEEGSNKNELIQQLLADLAQDHLDRRKKEKDRTKQRAEQAVQMAQEEKRAKDAKQSNCSHLNQRNETRLSGQYLSGTGQLCLVCKACGKDFFYPAYEGQTAIPRNLVPPSDEIGG